MDLSNYSTYQLQFLVDDPYVSDSKREACREELEKRKQEAQANY